MRSLYRQFILFLLVFTFYLTGCSAVSENSDPFTITPNGSQEITLTPALLPSATAEPSATLEPALISPTKTTLNPIYKDGLLYQFETQDQIVALTIDDGYSDQTLNKILTLLEENDLHATFFLVGNAVEGSLKFETLKRLIDDGNDIGYHSNAHPSLETIQKMTREDWGQDYELWTATLRNKLGEDLFEQGVIPYARVPYGEWTTAFMTICSEYNLTPVWWNNGRASFDKGRVPVLKGGIFLYHVVPDDLPKLQILLDSDWKVFSIRELMPEK